MIRARALRIALLANIRTSNSPGQAVHTNTATIRQICSVLARHGHTVVVVDASLPLLGWVAALQRPGPDLVFNLAEGTTGPLRQSFYTQVLTELGLPFTGSGPRAQALALDKQVAKLLVGAAGVPSPPAVLCTPGLTADLADLRYPCIVKPNFEGTSRGISSGSVVGSADEAAALADKALQEFPDGVLVESFVPGVDLTVPFLAGSRAEAGILEATQLRVLDHTGGPVDRILDYAIKHTPRRPGTPASRTVESTTPAAISDDVRATARELTRLAVETIGCLDVARVDYRLDPQGNLHFLEINALPGIGPGVSIHRAAQLAGADPGGGVVEAILGSASARFGL